MNKITLNELHNEGLSRDLIQRIEFRKFDQYDWDAWSGCTSPVPFISEVELDSDHTLVFILDGAALDVYLINTEDCECIFNTENVCELPWSK